ncbi:hypothetical protein [Burkholderia cenocepacia]|uniref:hypothetical protein n=1 Tax=Burkholderia cenocepacia TaxID=95486 RepID=UPI001FC8C057|nr:hypothetical protein [Burkholderia cenocepacia]USB85333.1 hypothetical protein NBG98_03200 [Burkholderia cenocepacia]
MHVVADLTAPPGRLSDGYRVQGRIVVWERMDVPSVPVGALFRCAEQWCAFEVDRGRAIRQVVQIGQRNAEAAQVLAGLQVGKTVVVYPATTLAENMSVRAR